MSRSTPGSSELVLMALVARRHYVARQSKVQIADDLGLSRFRVARLLDAAVDHGVVRIEVGIPGDVDLGLSAELREQFSLAHCIVVDTPDEDEKTLRRHIGMTTTQLLTEIVGPDDVLGLSSTRALMGLVDPVPRFTNCPVVQITGALSRPDASDVMEAVRRFSRAGGGPAYVFYAPLICHDEAAFDTYAGQPDVIRCREKFPDVTVSVSGMGAWKPGLSTVYDAVGKPDQEECAKLGVITEVGGLLLDEFGHTAKTPLSDRLMGMTEGELRAVPTRIGVAFDAGKAAAVRTALSSGIVNGLVTHRSLAQEILNESAAGSR